MFNIDLNTYNLSDNKLLSLSLTSPQVFNILLSRYQDKLYKRALSILRSEADAEDAVQETFVSIYLHAGQFTTKSTATFSSWAYTILTNKCYTLYRKKKRLRVSQTPLSPELEAILTGKNELTQHENVNLVEKLLNFLPPTLRQTMEKIYQGYSYEEIASEEQTAESSIRSRVHRAKKILQTKANELNIFC